MVVRVGSFLFSIGGALCVIGLILFKFPQVVSFLGKLPGDLSFSEKVFIPIGTMIVLSLAISSIALVFSFFLHLLK